MRQVSSRLSGGGDGGRSRNRRRGVPGLRGAKAVGNRAEVIARQEGFHRIAPDNRTGGILENFDDVHAIDLAADIFLPVLIGTFISFVSGMIAVAIYQRINLFKLPVLAFLGGFGGLMTVLYLWLKQFPPEKMTIYIGLVGSLIIFSIIISFLVLGFIKKENVYEKEEIYEGPNDNFLLNSRERSSSSSDSFASFKSGILFDLTGGFARIGPSGGIRYVVNFEKNFNYLQFYAIWKF